MSEIRLFNKSLINIVFIRFLAAEYGTQRSASAARAAAMWSCFVARPQTIPDGIEVKTSGIVRCVPETALWSARTFRPCRCWLHRYLMYEHSKRITLHGSFFNSISTYINSYYYIFILTTKKIALMRIIITLSLDATFRKEGKLTQQVLLRKRPDHLRLVWFSCDRSRRARASREAAAAGPPWGPRRARAASRHMPGGRGAPPACTSRERARDYRQLWATSLRRPSQPVLLELRSARNWRSVPVATAEPRRTPAAPPAWRPRSPSSHAHSLGQTDFEPTSYWFRFRTLTKHRIVHYYSLICIV